MIKRNTVEEQKKSNRKRQRPIDKNDSDLSRNMEFIQQEIKIEA